MTLLKRFEKKFAKTNGCWLWKGDKWSRPEHGYGRIYVEGKRVKAHRVAWELYVGPIPTGLHVLHKCDVRLCVNPDHLFLGTKADNAHDRNQKGRQARGKSFPQCKLTDEQVIAIRNDPRGDTALAAEYGVWRGSIYRIRSGKSRVV